MKKSAKIITIILIVVFAALIFAGYFMIKNYEREENKKLTSNPSESSKSADKDIPNDIPKDDINKIAVVYFSATGNTKVIAEQIKDETNADIIEIIPKKKYTSEDLNYNNSSTRATKEQNDDNARPEIENNIDLSEYDIIFLGYPIWWGDVPKIILSFIDNTNLDGKTVIPFCTSGSSDISTSESTLKSYKSSINWKEGKRFSGSSSIEEIRSWIDGLNIK